jgi:GNAT superfamily N-acetyltransferase
VVFGVHKICNHLSPKRKSRHHLQNVSYRSCISYTAKHLRGKESDEVAMNGRSTILQTLTLIAAVLWFKSLSKVSIAFAPPILGLGAVFFPVRNSIVIGISDNTNGAKKRLELQEVSDFFVDAFWTAKVGGGARTLSLNQRQQLEQSQNAEFTKRYGSTRKISEMLMIRSSKGNNEIMACVGVEVDRVPTNGPLRNPVAVTNAPLMSNLAVSRKYRRRGLAEQMVRDVETLLRKEWGYEECYLYVEEQNRAAMQLYQKLGYRKVWRDTDATTLLPTTSGDLQSTRTTIVCMNKKLNENFFQRMLRL